MSRKSGPISACSIVPAVPDRRVSGLLAALVVVWTACGGSAADHELLGDRAYVSRQFSDALIEYHLAISHKSTPRLRRKAAATAVHVGDLGEAAAQYVALAKESPASRDDAADGLERVARAAQGSDRAGLAAALAGLQQINARRALGAFAVSLAKGISESGSVNDAIAVLPVAAAAAPDARAQDSLVLQYARALGRAGRCQDAGQAYEGLVRRQRDPGVVRAAQQGLVQCALALGRQAIDSGRPQQAEEWFRKGVTDGGDTPLSRGGYLGLGDVMLARGDFAGAADAYLRAMQGAAPGDSIAERARQKLANLSNAGTGVR